MGQDVKVDRTLTFQGDASQEPNIVGSPDEKRIHVRYHFTELALDNTNKYTPFIDTTSSVALGSGGLLLTTAATNTKTCTQTQGGIWWYPGKNCTVEHKFRLDV